MMDNTFWAFAALVVFLGIAMYFKVPATITKSLDARGEKIKADLNEAARLRDEAKALLSEYEAKRKQAEKDAVAIVEAAKREADVLRADAKAKSEEFVRRRTLQAEQKIGQAQSEAISAVRASAVDIAIAASSKLLEGSSTAEQFKSALSEVKARLN